MSSVTEINESFNRLEVKMPVSDIQTTTTSSTQQLALPELVRRSISRAIHEDRLKFGIDDCIEFLYSCDPNKVLMVALTDASNDMLTQTILEAYCYEQVIPFVKIDSRVLARFLRPAQIGRLARMNSDPNSEPCCFLIMV